MIRAASNFLFSMLQYEGVVPSYSVSIWSIENCKQVVNKHIAGSGFDMGTPKTLLF